MWKKISQALLFNVDFTVWDKKAEWTRGHFRVCLANNEQAPASDSFPAAPWIQTSEQSFFEIKSALLHQTTPMSKIAQMKAGFFDWKRKGLWGATVRRSKHECAEYIKGWVKNVPHKKASKSCCFYSDFKPGYYTQVKSLLLNITHLLTAWWVGELFEEQDKPLEVLIRGTMLDKTGDKQHLVSQQWRDMKTASNPLRAPPNPDWGLF